MDFCVRQNREPEAGARCASSIVAFGMSPAPVVRICWHMRFASLAVPDPVSAAAACVLISAG